MKVERLKTLIIAILILIMASSQIGKKPETYVLREYYYENLKTEIAKKNAQGFHAVSITYESDYKKYVVLMER